MKKRENRQKQNYAYKNKNEIRRNKCKRGYNNNQLGLIGVYNISL